MKNDNTTQKKPYVSPQMDITQIVIDSLSVLTASGLSLKDENDPIDDVVNWGDIW